MEKGRSLESLLRDNFVTADDFFQSQGISAQVRSNLSRFVKYCRTHRQFSVRMIYLALNVSYAELENPKIKTATFAINELLANEQSQLADLFFDNRKKPDVESTEIPQELEEGIQSQAERLFRFDSDQEQTLPPQEPKAEQITGVQLVQLSLQILKNPQKNQTCLGHLQKMYSFFIRHDPIPVLAYLDEHSQVIQLLLNNVRYSSISSLLAQLLTSEDKNKEYKYQTLKKKMLVQVIEQIFSRLNDEEYFDGALILLEEILNTTKQSYYQYFEDFKRISNYMVSAQVLGRFYDELLKMQEISFGCISRFLESLFSRLNSESDEKDHYYQKEQNSPSMNFETDIFIKNVSTLLLLVPKITSFKSLTKISYLSFLETFLSSNQVKALPPVLNDPAFLGLFDSYKNQKTGGIVKSKIYGIINGILSRVSLQQIKEFVQLHPNLFLQYFEVIKAANYSNTKTYNRNQNSAFDVSLISQLTRKEEEALNNVSQILGKNFKRICKKYDTKIASFQNSPSFSLEEESNFYQYNSETNGVSKQNGEGVLTGFSLNFVGKNHISIPILQIPEKSNANSPENGEGREDLREERIARTTDYLKEVIQVQQVIVLTQKLDNFTNCNGIQKQNHKGQEITEAKEVKIDKPEQQKNMPSQKQTKQTQIQDFKFKKPSISISPIILPKKQSEKLEKIMPQIGGEQDRARFYTRHLVIFA